MTNTPGTNLDPALLVAINRIVADHLSDVLLCPSETAVENLVAEGITRNVHLTGDVMLDVLNWKTSSRKPSQIFWGCLADQA